MANKNMRTVKIYGMSGYKYQATPTIMLKGKWLEELGFEIGDYITVSCEDGRLIITPDAERAALAKAEQEFMDREMASLNKRFQKEKERLHAQFVAEKNAEYGVVRRRKTMGKMMNESDLLKRPFSELTISEQAAVLKARYDEETSEPGSQRIKTRGTIGEEYGLSGSSVGRLLKMNDLIEPLKDMLNRGSLYTKVALQLAFLPKNEQQMIYEIAKAEHVKLTVDMAIKLRSHSGVMTEAMIRRYLNIKTIKKKCYKVPARIVEKYFQGMDPNMVDMIVEQALDAWFGKEAADVQ